jgi:hypothetical protein
VTFTRRGADEQAAFNMFLGLLTMYKVLRPEEEAESSAMANDGGLPRDPAKRREAKIAQYKREKELRQKIAVRSPSAPQVLWSRRW